MIKLQKLFTDTFQRDIVCLLTASIIIGSLVAAGVSLGANTYFSKTLSGLVGDYGEYDIVLQVREEMKDDSATHIQKIIDEVFPGAKLKEGPTITGKTNFFVALPSQFKTKKVYEDLGKTFGGIPGGAGVGVMTEPRLTIRGVPEGAKTMLMDRISEMDGVRFTFHDGGSIGIILTSVDKTTAVNNQVNALLKQYQVIEISFPVGSEPSNPIRLGEAIAASVQNDLQLGYAQNVSVDGKNDDMTYMVSTMMELKRFLTAYATQVTLTPANSAALKKGDLVLFQGKAAAPPTTGSAPDKANVVVEITALGANGSAEGRITQGDATFLTNLQGYKLENNQVTETIVTASYKNPRKELGNALNDAGAFAGKMPELSQDAQNMSKVAMSVIDNYGNGISAVEQTLNSVQAASSTVSSVTAGLSNIDTSSLQTQLDGSAKALGGTINAMQVMKLLNSDVGSTLDSMTAAQRNILNLKSYLSAISNVANDAKQAKNVMDNIVVNGRNTLTTLKAFDINGAKTSLSNANDKMNEIQQLNSGNIATQLAYLAAAAPNLTDEEINHSVNLLDKFIAGQVIPGERIQILTTANVNADLIAPIVYKQVGHNNVSLYASASGVIEPNPRAELYQVLTEVKAILAGMTAMVLTIMLLVFDHTAIMTVIRRKRLESKNVASGLRRAMNKFSNVFSGTEHYYGMLIGAILLTGMFTLAQGGFPYLPRVAVPFLGALLGLIAANYAEKISPVSNEEVMAGEALGMSFDEIMREIVIPSARPGLLQKLNQRKTKFK